jgi:hypothetical protein
MPTHVNHRTGSFFHIFCRFSSEHWTGTYVLYIYVCVPVGRSTCAQLSKGKVFQYSKDRVWRKIQGWKEKLLSRAGKDILLKAVAQAIPTYAMSCFDLTKSLCDDISKMINRSWWAQQDKENKMHWLSWDTLCRRKEKGGLGYRDLHLFNLASPQKKIYLTLLCWLDRLGDW